MSPGAPVKVRLVGNFVETVTSDDACEPLLWTSVTVALSPSA